MPDAADHAPHETSRMRAVAVFCGSRRGADPAYAAAADALGRGLAEAGVRLVYGGGRIGLMGVVADAALAAGGQVLGEPMDIPTVGAYVAFLDTEGNRSSMLQPLPR